MKRCKILDFLLQWKFVSNFLDICQSVRFCFFFFCSNILNQFGSSSFVVLSFSLLVEIEKMFADTRVTETILGPVIQAGLDALKVV